jgi:hypothetical protein
MDNPKLVVQVICFICHFCLSIILLGFLFGCDSNQFNSYMYGMKAYDYNMYTNSSMNTFTCNNTMKCFRQGIPWDNGYEIWSMYFSPNALLFVLEWITACFALFYLRVNVHLLVPTFKIRNIVLQIISLVWLGIGCVMYIIYFAVTRQTNYLEFIILSVAFGVSAAVMLFFDKICDLLIKRIFGNVKSSGTVFSSGKLWNLPLQAAFTLKSAPKGETKGIKLSSMGETKGSRLSSVSETDPLLIADSSKEEEFRQRLHVIIRYIEYCCSAPMLYLCILGLVVVDAPFWGAMIGGTCILASCLYGIGVHIMHTLECCSPHETTGEAFAGVPVIHASIFDTQPKLANTQPKVIHAAIFEQTMPNNNQPQVAVITNNQSQVINNNQSKVAVITNNQPKLSVLDNDPGRMTYLYKYNDYVNNTNESNLWNILLASVNLGKWRCNWVMKIHLLQLSWISLGMALCIIIYLARELLITASVLPMYVLASVWILLIMYCAFAVTGTLFYYILDHAYWNKMDMSLDILSLLAKMPIILALAFGYLGSPGSTCKA